MDKLGWIVVSNNMKLSGRRGKHSRSSAEQLPWASAWYLRRSHGSLAHSQEQFLESIQPALLDGFPIVPGCPQTVTAKHTKTFETRRNRASNQKANPRPLKRRGTEEAEGRKRKPEIGN